MNLFQILATDMCSDPLVQATIGAVRTVFTVIQIAIPVVLIVLCTIDMFKAITSGDEKKTKEAWKTAGRRLIYALIAFLIPWLISLIFSFAGNIIDDPGAADELNDFGTFLTCWDGAENENLNDKQCCKVGAGSYKFYDDCGDLPVVGSSYCE